MAVSFANAKLVSSLMSKAIKGRGFSVATAAAASQSKAGAARSSAAMVKKTGEEIVGSTEKVSWVPDPRTGFYRPENVAEEIDVAELRAALLKKH